VPVRRPALLALAVAAALAGAPARGEVVDLVFRDDGRFERSFALAPGKFAELCGRIGAGQAIDWSWQADAAVDFNIHFHVGKDVRYPARLTQRQEAQGELVADTTQDYCWMWNNRSSRSIGLRAGLRRR
jgi:hypothetical protein